MTAGARGDVVCLMDCKTYIHTYIHPNVLVISSLSIVVSISITVSISGTVSISVEASSHYLMLHKLFTFSLHGDTWLWAKLRHLNFG